MSDLRPAVRGVLGQRAHRRLLQATVEVARAVFSGPPSFSMHQTDELVFEAVARLGPT